MTSNTKAAAPSKGPAKKSAANAKKGATAVQGATAAAPAKKRAASAQQAAVAAPTKAAAPAKKGAKNAAAQTTSTPTAPATGAAPSVQNAALQTTSVSTASATAPAASVVATPAAAPALKPPAAPDKDANGVLMEVTLNWADLTGAKTGATALGSNKFYKATIVEANPGEFVVTFRYGRVGSEGQVQIERCSTFDEAKRTLNSKVSSKERKGYTRLEMRSEADERAKALARGVKFDDAPKKVASAPSRQFHPQVSSLLKTMYSATGTAIKAGLSSSSGASEEAPLGNLHDTQLDRGADILERIESLLETKKKVGRDELVELTNQYLSNIPRNIDHARSGGRLDLDVILLNSKQRIEKERSFLTLLRDAHLAKEIFSAAAHAEDPVEVWYEGLNCNLDFVEAGSEEFKYVANLFDRGQSPMNANFFGKLRVSRVWSLERHGEKANYQAFSEVVTKKNGATGITPGWHGTRTENLMGISRSGLLMPENLPKGVQVTGKAFGMGIYHAPCWTDSGQPREENGQTFTRYNGALKSMNYTSIAGAYWNPESSSAKGFLFLEELALGVPEVHLTACWGKHRPDEGADYIYAKAFGNPQLSHDEVVTFHEHASRMTHLLEIEKR